MNTKSSGICGSLLVALVVGLIVVPRADAKGPRGGRSGGRAARAPHVSAPRRASKAPMARALRMPGAASPARANVARGNNAQARANRAAAATRRPKTGTVNPATSAAVHTMSKTPNNLTPNTYTYGSGTGARRYRAYGYGQGYRNRSYGGHYGYGRSQGHTRSIVARLRSVHASLSRLDHDYRGHRVRAMHAIAMAIRQLTHRSMVNRGVGFAPGAGVGARRAQPMSQAQSDARMGQALRTLQGIHMQLGSQGYNTPGHARARGHVRRAIRELNTALSIR